MTKLVRVLLSLAFLLLYWAPLLLEPRVLPMDDRHIYALLRQAWMSGTVREGASLFIASSLVLCAVTLWFFSWLGRWVARLFGISPTIGHALALLFGWMLLVSVNRWWFPYSNYSYALSLLDSVILGKVALSLLAILLLVILYRAIPVMTRAQRLAGICVALGGLGLWAISGAAHVEPRSGRSIVIVGVDSLSAHAFASTAEQTPVLHGLYAQSMKYTRAYVPLGRTYPSWTSILSGQYPQQHGAVFNLRGLAHVAPETLLSTQLQKRGYRTVFAIDERRFNNMDKGFGFDVIVGPKAGVLDVALQSFADTPLTNLLMQTPLAGWLFPYAFVNTAIHVNYSDTDFVQAILDSVGGGGDVFLATHFESAHFPYKTRHAHVKVKTDNPFWDAHVEALSVVDHQVDLLMDGLRQKGVLNDALVVLLSDHGEGVGEIESVVAVDGQPFEVTGYGHGANVLSDRQNRVLLATLVYKNGRVVSAPGEVSAQVGLTDVRAAMERYLAGQEPQIRAKDDCMMVETGIRFFAAENYKTLDEAALAQQGAGYYEVTAQGLMQLREDRIAELVATKDIGVRCLGRISYYVAASGRVYGFALDAQGVPIRQIVPPVDDIARIEAYRNAYRSQFPASSAAPGVGH
ncbi:sulfatase-like hydrolase/transferase [Pseudomonas sp. PDM23]|uniref:sulfatase-like hydrolase/transferase n=1 Tax=unclassified Pseudomonas TaxID=196821 RepID=UPI00177EC5EF|nr:MULTISPECIES: sulfatase-like hydrolase/transferase [unclassified Pseudomonas]MBD9502899.1 sulfatase-like hydrolase/transferase [Pseudomonas sp. PDM17]MBD9574627.1 sulfatase-like hydrolase/transferase [Pseudomonas sp. PDM23]MBD9673952.1 sulfatase-like hydrolase/transferase [Pseudomonas sp. PDM21]